MITTLEVFIDERGPYEGTLRVETEKIDITSGRTTYKDDPQWTFVDKAGHFHAITADGKFPTLEAYVKRRPCPGGCGDPGCEGEIEGRYRCRLCRKRIRPGRVVDRVAGARRYMPGVTTWTVTVPTQQEWPDDVTIRATSRNFEAFGIATPRLQNTTSYGDGAVHVYEFLGITELGRRP